MARLDQGLLGGFSGKLGTTVGASWKGINVVRTYQPTVANPNSPAQQNHRTLFADWAKLASFLLADFVKPLWDRKAKKMSGYNAFVSANMNSTNDTGHIYPPSIILSQGVMGNTIPAEEAVIGSGFVAFEWDGMELPIYGSKDDVLFALVFNPEGELLAKFPNGIIRNDNQARVENSALANIQECYIVSAWMSADGKFQSNTDCKHVVKE